MKIYILDGPTYTNDNRPPNWRNAQPLHVRRNHEMEDIPTADCPLIDDFEVQIAQVLHVFGYSVYFFSPSHGYLARFPWWDHAERDLIRADFKIPMRTFDMPLNDLEQGWEIFIAGKDDFVYILEGEFEKRGDGFYSWCKVDKERYLAEWQKAIQLCKDKFATE